MYSLLFYSLRNFTTYVHEKGNKTTVFGHEVDASILLSIMMSFNIASFWLYFKFMPITTNYNLDGTILLIILNLANWFILIQRRKSMKIVEKFEKKSPWTLMLFNIVTLIYVILSYCLFVLIV
jgi:hypothetical protein